MARELNDVLQEGVRKNQVLALDIAEHCGYYSSVDNYGVAWFPNREKAPKYMGGDYDQYIAFADWLEKMIIDNNIRILAVEDLNFSRNALATIKLAQFHGVMLLVAAEMGVPVRYFNVKSIKKHTTGDGKADKKKMLEWAIKRYHLDFEGRDDACDAACVWFYFYHLYTNQLIK
jgi:Holliday junction resolvasome RuvABC endonuclease subunit